MPFLIFLLSWLFDTFNNWEMHFEQLQLEVLSIPELLPWPQLVWNILTMQYLWIIKNILKSDSKIIAIKNSKILPGLAILEKI